jgi:ABC-type multidrug transport system fused ATPase/permease subunit
LEGGEYKYFEPKAGEILHVYDFLPEDSRRVLAAILDNTIPLIATLGVSTIYMTTTHWCLAIPSTLCLAISGGLTVVYGSEISKLAEQREQTWYRVAENVNNSFGNLMNIYTNNTVDPSIKCLHDDNMLYERGNILVADCCNTFGILAKLLFTLSFFTTVMLAIYLLRRRKISNQTFNSIIVSTSSVLLFTLGTIDGSINTVFEKVGECSASSRLINRLGSTCHRTVINTSTDLDWGKVDIEFKDVYFSYSDADYKLQTPNDKGVENLKKMNLLIHNQRTTAVIGSAGCGKTTMVKLLLKLYSPVAGVITIGGRDISTIDNRELRSQVSYINQRTQLWEMSVLDNIMYGHNNPEQATIKLFLILEKYDITVFSLLEQGLYTNAGPLGNNISLGTQKIILILRSILKPSPIILLDEPLTSLDSVNIQKVCRMLKHELIGRTAVIITHHEEILDLCHYTIKLF